MPRSERRFTETRSRPKCTSPYSIRNRFPCSPASVICKKPLEALDRARAKQVRPQAFLTDAPHVLYSSGVQTLASNTRLSQAVQRR